jgi:hypothetical protein
MWLMDGPSIIVKDMKPDQRPVAYLKLCLILDALATPEISNLAAVFSLGMFLREPDVLKLGQAGRLTIDKLIAHATLCGEDWRLEGSSLVKNLSEDARKSAAYAALMVERAKKGCPTIPNVMVELKCGDLEARDEPDYVDGLINWTKLKPFAKQCGYLTAFQRKAYRYVPIPQVQKAILRARELSQTLIDQKFDEITANLH